MPRKGGGRRRNKGSSSMMEADDGDENYENVDHVDVLSDSHTIASFATSTTTNNDLSGFENVFGDDGDNDGDLDQALLTGGGGSSADASSDAAQMVRQEKLAQALAPLLDLPTEKRSARREGTLKKLFRALTQFATGYEGSTLVAQRLDELTTACKYPLRAGSPSEQYAACRVLEATAVVLYDCQDGLYESIHKFLGIVAKSVQKATPVRIAALRAMAMCVFLMASQQDDHEHVHPLLDLCQDACQVEWRNSTTPDALRAAALDCWTLVATTVDPALEILIDDDEGRGTTVLLPVLQQALEQTTCMQLRSAAGECMSFLHETRLSCGITATDDNVDTTAQKYAQGSWEGSEWEDTVAEIQQLIASLAVESTRHLSKKSKKELRATFREFQATVVDDEAPSQVIAFRGAGTLELNSWREIVPLNFMRHCLQGGFQIQLLTNPTLHEIFGASSSLLNNGSGGYSQLEKRLLLSKTSQAAKEKDQALTKNRRKRQNVKNHFLTVDDE